MLRKSLLLGAGASLLVGLSGCTTSAPAMSSPSAYDALVRYCDSGEEEGVSLFKGDSEVLSDQEIARILDFHFQPRPQNRLAVMKLRSSRYWSEADAELEQASRDAFLARLRAATSVVHAAELPRLLAPGKQTIPYLREAAARYQADLLLIYDTEIHTFTKYRTWKKDKVRALCTVNALLLDVRRGIVPFTSRKTETVQVVKSADDLNFAETIAKAMATAEGKALTRIAAATCAFLDHPESAASSAKARQDVPRSVAAPSPAHSRKRRE